MKAAVTREGVMVDALTFEALSSPETTLVEETLALNPGLAAALAGAGHALRLDAAVLLPAPRAARDRKVATVKLWD